MAREMNPIDELRELARKLEEDPTLAKDVNSRNSYKNAIGTLLNGMTLGYVRGYYNVWAEPFCWFRANFEKKVIFWNDVKFFFAKINLFLDIISLKHYFLKIGNRNKRKFKSIITFHGKMLDFSQFLLWFQLFNFIDFLNNICN